jgi:hypothetical protein
MRARRNKGKSNPNQKDEDNVIKTKVQGSKYSERLRLIFSNSKFWEILQAVLCWRLLQKSTRIST